MKIYSRVSDLVGRTPLMELGNWCAAKGCKARIIAKLEYFNPAGSVKDRVGLNMIIQAEKRGDLKPGSTIIEPTSGNTGIGLAAIAASRGYKSVFVMPETMSVERQKLLTAYGAQVVLTPGDKGMIGSIEKAEELAKEIPGSFLAGQFENPDNPGAHFASTGPEIWEDTDGNVDAFVACVGTGGTVNGTGSYLKQQNGSVRVVAVEPATSAVMSGQKAGPHKIQGIGAGFIPKTMDMSVVDEIATVGNEEAYETTRQVAKCEGILVGISSGAALAAATELALRDDMAGKTIVVLLPDTGERYLSAGLF